MIPNRLRFYIAISLLLVASELPGQSKTTPTEKWRSRLYPADWKPGDKDKKGHFLQDYSYAGYRNGEKSLPVFNNTVIYDIVKDFKADTTAGKDSSQACQKAISQAAKNKGGIIYIPKGLYRFEHPIRIEHSNILITGEGPEKTRIFFTCPLNNNADILLKGKPVERKEIKLAKDADVFDTELYLESVKDLKKNTDIEVGFVISKEFCNEHGMNEFWNSSKGQWKPFFRREIIDINPKQNQITIDVPLRYPVKTRDKASIKVVDGLLDACGIKNLSLANATKWEKAWETNRVFLVQMDYVKDCWFENVHSFEPPTSIPKGYHLQSGGILISHSKRVTVVGCDLKRVQNRGNSGNGNVFELSQSCEILIKNCQASQGHHNFIQNGDFNTNGCVFLRVKSNGAKRYIGRWDPLGIASGSEFHHALSMANLVDSCQIDDCWTAINRQKKDNLAGHTSTQNVFWNITGNGTIHSAQYGFGYIIGTGNKLKLRTSDGILLKGNTLPLDFVEGAGKGSNLVPQSLYEAQLNRRLNGKNKENQPVPAKTGDSPSQKRSSGH